ncbi:neurofilament medium polypeptide protein [Stemphylium lycopersici]|uniref:Neurofilament medium polypeptide protein n=1 Tax=Stemphylium lycopersici TaxID=183478 RepID=A0A364NBM0_STELY|nr:neurofilament medium polypeptide protein [Stemphylium lycopersici]RAR11525.1 neurofilament medium polypeptide protein [Stemphylium lycopersici]RAR14719.1 neurofilament medium polypeptide protein [Stemphylium lycopersici]
MLLPTSLLTLLHLALPALSHASPQPALISTDYAISLVPKHTLFLRQLSNLQTFEDNLGGAAAPPISNSGDEKRPFEVEGDTFTDFDTAAQRSCDVQFKGCSDAANGNGGGGGGGGGDGKDSDNNNNGDGDRNGNDNRKRQNDGLSVNDCDEQKNKCNDAQKNAQVKDFNSAVPSTNIGPDPDFPDFDLICEG